MTLEQMLPTIIIAIIGGLLGIVIKGLSSEIKGMHDDMKGLVSKEVCSAHREKLEADINNIGDIARSK